MAEKSLLIIGAGVGGLSTGCYARMNGYGAHIVEMAQRAGGVCTSWQRHGYVFDSCIFWLSGSRDGSPLNGIWRELGALAGRDIVNHDEFMRVEGRDGQALVIYTNADRLEAHLRELAPGDVPTSRLLCDAIRDGATLLEGHATTALPRLLANLPRLVPLVGTTWQQFCARYDDRFVRDALRVAFDRPGMPFVAAVSMFSYMHAGDAGYPIGGSLGFAQGIEQRFRELGGTITYGARVEEILVDNDRAVGVRLRDGTIIRADVVVSAADGHSTLFDMLGGRYGSDKVMAAYTPNNVVRPLIQVSLGVALDLSGQPPELHFMLAAPVKIAEATRDSLIVRQYGYDPTMAPQGKSAVTVRLETDYDWWLKLAGDDAGYRAAKSAVADAVVAALDQRFPGLAGAVEAIDVATPITWVRYTGNWRGAFRSWLQTRQFMVSRLGGALGTLPELAGFYMVGQWLTGGGLPAVAPAGRRLVQHLCRIDGKPFVTTMASHAPARLLPAFGATEIEPQDDRVREGVVACGAEGVATGREAMPVG